MKKKKGICRICGLKTKNGKDVCKSCEAETVDWVTSRGFGQF